MAYLLVWGSIWVRADLRGPLGLTSTCWQVWISFPIRDSSSLFLLIKLLRLESRACCSRQIKKKQKRTTQRVRNEEQTVGTEMQKTQTIQTNQKDRRAVQSRKSKEDKNATDFSFLGFSASTSQRSCKTTSGATSQNNEKVWKQVENNYILENTRQNEQKTFDSSAPEQQRQAMFSLNSSSQASSGAVVSFFFLKRCVHVHVPLNAGDTPHPCTASSSCPVRASDREAYSRRGCDWDSHSTEHQAMRKPGQAAN